jgi:hypothetical protein
MCVINCAKKFQVRNLKEINILLTKLSENSY